MTAEAMLRPLSIDDLDNVMTWVNDPEIIGNFQNFSLPITRDNEKVFLERLLASDTDKVFALENEEGTYLGNIGLHQIHWPSRNGRLAIVIGNKDYQGKGYAQSAIGKALDLAFDQYGLHKVWLVVFEQNEKARHVYQKCGFREEGLLKDEYFHRGRFHTMIRMAVLEDEFRQKVNENDGGAA